MPRPAEPADLDRFRIPSEPRCSPDGRWAAFTLQTIAPKRDGYRHAVWIVATDGSGPARQLTLGAKHDRQARFSPDGRTLAFLSDRRLLVEEAVADGAGGGGRPGGGSGERESKEREDATQVYLLPLDGGEARRLTDLPRGVEAFEWSPDGRSLVVVSVARGATREEEDRLRGRRRGREAAREPAPRPDFRYIDRLGYQYNGVGFIDDRETHLWLVDVETGRARKLTDGPGPESAPAWSPDGRRIAFVANRRPNRDIVWRSDVWVVEVEGGRQIRITGGEGAFDTPCWLPDGATLAVLGHRFPAGSGSRNDIWLFPADGSDNGPTGGRNLSERHDLMPGSAMNSDLTIGEGPRLVVAGDGRLLFSAPVDGAYALWAISTTDGAVERLTVGREYVSAFDAARVGDRTRVVYLRSAPTALPDLWSLEVPGGAAPTRLTALNDEVLGDVVLVEPEERSWEVDGRRIQGWYLPPLRDGRLAAAADGPQPLVLEIHGGPQTLYGWSPMWEWQVLAGSGIGVLAANPRGSQGYGQAFCAANRRDWGDGPMRDVLGGVDLLVAEGRADPARLGVTGGSYGGYLTNWIVSHDRRFRAAVTCRSVSDMTSLMLTGDISGGDWAKWEFGVTPWEDPAYFRSISPLTYAARIRTPLLIQHAENDLRTTIAQAEALFTVLRSLRRPVRFMRVPGETHELTRSGTPFRRVENLVQIRNWFRHFLVLGRRRLPPKPPIRAGA
jgi:acylaminoacyl-peptidase